MAILSCHVSIKLPPKISDGQKKSNNSKVKSGNSMPIFSDDALKPSR